MDIKFLTLKKLLFLSAIAFLISCEPNLVYEKNDSIQDEKWHYRDKVEFKVEITDTVNMHNIHINVRNSVDYNYMNLYMFLNTEFPDGRIVRDTLECILADRRGEWLGDGFGRIKSHQFLFRENTFFPQKGEYIFRFEQAMREEVLEGITDIGIRIERK